MPLLHRLTFSSERGDASLLNLAGVQMLVQVRWPVQDSKELTWPTRCQCFPSQCVRGCSGLGISSPGRIPKHIAGDRSFVFEADAHGLTKRLPPKQGAAGSILGTSTIRVDRYRRLQPFQFDLNFGHFPKCRLLFLIRNFSHGTTYTCDPPTSPVEL